MRFTVPQFIDREAKIVGPLSLKQFLTIGSAGAICFILWFTYGKGHFFLFLVFTLVIMFSALALSFVKVGGLALPLVIKNIAAYSVAPKLYLWNKKETPGPKLVMRKVVRQAPKKDEEEGPTLKFAEKSQLKDLAKELNTKP